MSGFLRCIVEVSDAVACQSAVLSSWAAGRYVAASIEKTLGALPVVADFCRRLNVAGIIDRACLCTVWRASVTDR
jgi:hypothetical protein